MKFTISGKNIDVTEGSESSSPGQAWKAGALFYSGYRSDRDDERGEGAPED